MREIRITTPASSAARIASVARSCGLDRVTEYAVYIHGPDEAQTVLSVETSTPNARRFMEALVAAPFFDPRLHIITSRDLRAIVSETPVSDVTTPIMASRPDIDQELWQASHVTSSYLGRTFCAAILLSYALIHNNLLGMIAGLLFTPFLMHALAVGFGAKNRDWPLVRQGVFALVVGGGVVLLGGVVVALLTDAPFRFDSYPAAPVSVGISAIIGVAAGLATADDAARRPLIGLAAASQFAIYPAWFGIMLVRGAAFTATGGERAAVLLMNSCAIIVAAVVAYAVLGAHGEHAVTPARAWFRRRSGGASARTSAAPR